MGAFANAGQICVAVERVYVHEAVAEPFLAALVQRRGPARPTRSRSSTAGSATRRPARRAGRAAGAQVLTGGEVPEGAGAFYPATVLAGCTEDMDVMREETFGPVAAVRVVSSFDEALPRRRSRPTGWRGRSSRRTSSTPSGPPASCPSAPSRSTRCSAVRRAGRRRRAGAAGRASGTARSCSTSSAASRSCTGSPRRPRRPARPVRVASRRRTSREQGSGPARGPVRRGARRERADGRARRAGAALAAPALALALLAVPGVQQAGARLLALDEVAALRPVAVDVPGTGRLPDAGWGTTVSGGSPVTVSSGTIGRQPRSASDGRRARPVPLPPPPQPAAPWQTAPPVAGRTQAPVPPVELGPVRRLTRSGGGGRGGRPARRHRRRPRAVLGARAPRATYWLDDSTGTTTVHRADGSGTYDLWYRWASRS